MSSIKKFIEHKRVQSEINSLKEYLKLNPLNISDVIDEKGFQYVDLVQEGGGVLGIGLIGFTYALEEANVRFLSLAGASAGAINSILLGSVGTPNEKKSIKILKIINDVDFLNFVDGGDDALSLIMNVTKGNLFKSLLNITRFADDFLIRNELGLNRGRYFYNWLKTHLSTHNISSTKEVLNKMNSLTNKLSSEGVKSRLAIIASDITTQTKVSFPEMADLYYKDYNSVNPADYVRASMSIPLFFDPFIVKDIPKGEKQKKKWQNIEKAFFLGSIPDEVTFVDGGVMSNFPIDIFHIKDRIPKRPTFGVKLGIDRYSLKDNSDIVKILLNSFSAARQMRDHDVLLKNPEFRRLVSNIDNGNINWLNFNLKDDEKIELFVQGVVAACKFLKEFNWIDYKKVREFNPQYNINKASIDIGSLESFSASFMKK